MKQPFGYLPTKSPFPLFTLSSDSEIDESRLSL